jgi:hypothetical protein
MEPYLPHHPSLRRRIAEELHDRLQVTVPATRHPLSRGVTQLAPHPVRKPFTRY